MDNPKKVCSITREAFSEQEVKNKASSLLFKKISESFELFASNVLKQTLVKRFLTIELDNREIFFLSRARRELPISPQFCGERSTRRKIESVITSMKNCTGKTGMSPALVGLLRVVKKELKSCVMVGHLLRRRSSHSTLKLRSYGKLRATLHWVHRASAARRWKKPIVILKCVLRRSFTADVLYGTPHHTYHTCIPLLSQGMAGRPIGGSSRRDPSLRLASLRAPDRCPWRPIFF